MTEILLSDLHKQSLSVVVETVSSKSPVTGTSAPECDFSPLTRTSQI